MKKWVKVPGPGEYRGEGEWVELHHTHPGTSMDRDAYWNQLKQTGFLPTREQEEKPGEDEK